MSLDLGKNKIKKEHYHHDTKIEEKKKDDDFLISWRGLEFEKNTKNQRWYFIVSLIIATIIGYAIFTDSPIMAFTFILIGVTGYLYLQKEPREINFAINHDGIIIGNEIYEFEDMESFWIFYYPPEIKILSLHMKEKILPHVHIPIYKEDPVKIREIILQFVPEEKQEPGIVDAIERLLHI